jgi:HlyD family secretion protein
MTAWRKINMKKKIIISLGIIAAAVIAFLIISAGRKNSESTYQFAQITRGDLENTVSATGTVNPVHTVEVGTQVSGTIDRLNVDFNDTVHKGQVLAVLDTSLLKAAVLDARAQVDRNQALCDQAVADQQRNLPLFQKGYISEQEFLPLEISVKTTRASLQSAQIALKRAETNLSYAVIRSPIDGSVIQRAVEQGQTVAASLQAPTLFVIAENLSQMEIHAQVDESDIGYIREGQAVRFDVQAYPDKIFTGSVKQVRLEPTTVQNVVNYTVIVDAPNPDGLLLPGMTATIDFIVEQRKNVLLAPSAVLRLQPTQEMLEELHRTMQQRFKSMPDSARSQARERVAQGRALGGSTMQDLSSGDNSQNDVATLWFFDEKERLNTLPVRKGITDGQLTEIAPLDSMAAVVGGPHTGPAGAQARIKLHEGLEVISGVTGGVEVSSSENQHRRPMFGGRPPF